MLQGSKKATRTLPNQLQNRASSLMNLQVAERALISASAHTRLTRSGWCSPHEPRSSLTFQTTGLLTSMLLVWTRISPPPVLRPSFQIPWTQTQAYKQVCLAGDQTSSPAVSNSLSRRRAFQDLTGIAFLLSSALPSQAKQTGYKLAPQPGQLGPKYCQAFLSFLKLTTLWLGR